MPIKASKNSSWVFVVAEMCRFARSGVDGKFGFRNIVKSHSSFSLLADFGGWRTKSVKPLSLLVFMVLVRVFT